MTDWIDFSVYAAVNAFFWFVMPAGISRTGLLWAMDRNPRWLSEHPQTAAKLNDNRRYLWTCYVLGTLCLAALAACQLGFWPQALSAPAPEHWRVLKDVNSATVLVAVAFYCVSTFVFGRVSRNVPLADQRQASLEPRTIDDFVPRRFRVATYSLVCGHIAAWLGAGAWLAYTTPSWWANVVKFGGAALAFVVTHLVFLGIVRFCVDRRPNTLDRLFGPAYRLREVRSAFAFNLLPPITGGLRLYSELTSSMIADRLSHLGLVFAMLVLGVSLLRPLKERPVSGAGPSACAKPV
jgi:hypothetical protein